MKNRTGIDWSKHEVIVTDQEYLKIWHIKKPDTVVNNVKFINTNGILAVTGDFGNWIFCREFWPSVDGGVSDGYWGEKLKIASEQTYSAYDTEETAKEIEEMLNGGLEEYGYEGEELEQMKEYLTECLAVSDDELEYTYQAYRNMPSFMDYEQVIFRKSPHRWLLAVFDAFDEICRRMKEEAVPDLINR